MLTAEQLVGLYLSEPERPIVIDLSGGQPDLVPEWVPWMMRALSKVGLSESVFLWSDDNLSNDYFWRFLTEVERSLVSSYQCYSKVCCFKGFDDESFAFNTGAAPNLFQRQFELMRRLLTETQIDLYAYVTLTGPNDRNIEAKVADFMDRLQGLNRSLPLRTVPLEIGTFSPVLARGLTDTQATSTGVQQAAIAVWNSEIERRFSTEDRLLSICDVRYS
jgi:hypothetical protein